MADPVNPYMPSGLDRLSMMLMAMGSGVSNAEASGRSGWAGIPQGAAMFSQGMGQANQQAMQWDLQNRQHQQQEQYRKAQEENIRSQIDERKRAAALDEKIGAWLPSIMGGMGGGAPPGMGVPPATPTMGPGPELLAQGPQKAQYLTEKHGLPPVAAAGVVGNLYQESGFNPNAKGDGGTAYGMGQWRGDRQQALTAFAQSQGKMPSDPQVQLDFIAHEGKGGDMGAQRAWQMLQTAKTPQEATTAMMHYFRPAGYTPANPTGGHGYNNRVQYSQALMPGGGAAPPNAGGQGDSTGVQLAQSGNPQVQPQQGGATIQPPRVDPMSFLPLMRSKTFAPLGQAGISIGNAETDRYMKDQDRLQKRQQFEQEQKMRERSQSATERNQDVVLGPDGQPQVNETAVSAKTAVSAAQGTDTTGKMLLGDYDAVRKANTEMQEGAAAARNGLMQTKRLGQLLEGVASGTFTGSTQEILKAAKGIGIDLGALGIVDKTDKIEAANALSNQMALTLRNPAGGAGMPGAMSDSDRTFLQKMVPGIETTPEGRKLMLDFAGRLYHRQLKMAKIANDFMRSPEAKKDPNALYQKLQDYADANPLFDEKDLPQPKQAAPGSLQMPNPYGTQRPRALRWNVEKGVLE